MIVAGIYEIKSQIGAGGGGIAYLGWHMRLNKPVVLKADKRTLTAKPEALRREVDILKNLSHTYIPQVYDFVQEDNTVYTVMDFIEGESLDKMLAQNRVPTQPQVIKWACQLLEALSYLHSRKPYGILHGDIKPANIMLKPDGDICLIDYNIALALGEKGAVKVGFSRGYASPEHYGAEYIRGRSVTKAASEAAGSNMSYKTEVSPVGDETEVSTSGRTEISPVEPVEKSSSTHTKDAVLLDVRSDIYSLGATLYHLISGRKPDPDALQVEPLDAKVCSLAVAKIINKAMNPDPDKRYQTADEMLEAFLQLHEKDARVIRHKRRERAVAAVLALMLAAGAGCTFLGQRQMRQTQSSLALAEYSADALSQGNVSEAVSLALEGIALNSSVWDAPITAQVQKALTDALGVYDLEGGFKSLDSVSLPSAPFKLVISPKGKYFAALYAYVIAIYDTESGEKIVSFPAQESALSDALFASENVIVYAGRDGVSCYDIAEGKMLWTGEAATTIALSGDKSVAACVDRNANTVTLYSVDDGETLAQRSFEEHSMTAPYNDIFADAKTDLFALNDDGSYLAVSFSDGAFYIYDMYNPEEDLIMFDSSDYTLFEGGFSGDYLAFAANKSGESLFGLIDVENASYLGGFESDDSFYVQADDEGVYLANGNLLEFLDVQTLSELELAYTGDFNITGFSISDGYALVATDDESFSFYDSGANLMSKESCDEDCDFVCLANGYAVVGNRSETAVRIMKLENHSDALLSTYDARYEHDEARISADGLTAMLFSYEGFAVYDMDGELVASVELPDADKIYDQQFRRDGKSSWLEVTWYDGTVRCYDASDGEMLSETEGTAPGMDLYEEFYTDKYRITSELHGAPEVYDIETEKLVAVLESDDYLTYVTQVGDYIITEYVSADGERYGLVLDSNFGTIAKLPQLCDIIDEDTLVFDDNSGNLRQCRLYSLQELVALGESYIVP